ncbi:MAG TPA: SH3 domain-containing protein [Steroidobacteraceae bacterium]|nr:SH3 domain-containing protein [Steroidobacteraceae bacterium]
MRRPHALFGPLLTLLIVLTGVAAPFAAARAAGHKILIADPYIELHTGPGRGYPVFHVVERGREVTIVKRRTDWFQLRTDRGVEGWATREQMIATLEPTGEPLDLQEPARENYMSRRWQAGVMAGDFGGASLVSMFGGYAFSDNLSIELTLNHILGEFSNGYSATLGLMHVFVPEWRISPYFTLGTGIIYTEPKSTLVQSVDRDDQIGYVGGGLQFYLTRRFMLRTEYRNNVIFTSRDDNEEVDEWKYLGFAFFF